MKVRFTVSPTGSLHVGNALAAVINRSVGGTMLPRIDDIDMARDLRAGEAAIVARLAWLGVGRDEGPVRESERQERYRAAAAGLPRRFSGVTLLRGDGTATYHLASVVDDIDFAITHVIRGNDHRPNGALHRELTRALGSEPPAYLHFGLVLGPDGKKLSKRHGAQSLDEFHDMGYYAPALMNFLALLGWSYDDKTTIMSRDELIERFSFDRVQGSPAALDYKKLDWMNGVYLRALSPDEYATALVDYLGPTWDPDKVRRTAPLVQEKLTHLGEFVRWANFYFRDDVEPEDPSVLDANVISRAHDALAQLESWDAASIETTLRGLAAEQLEALEEAR